MDTVAAKAKSGLEQLPSSACRSLRADEALKELQNVLKLPQPPSALRAMTSPNPGAMAVGSMVFLSGQVKTGAPTSFPHKDGAGANDYAMLEEVRRRRIGTPVRGRPATAGRRARWC
jgi:excinuclease UvrABC nuclease subunit